MWLSKCVCGRFSPVKLFCVTMAVWLCFGVDIEASVLNLKRFIGCAVREFTFLARKPGCGGLHITTDACWGRCETWEVRIFQYPLNICSHSRNKYIHAYIHACIVKKETERGERDQYRYSIKMTSFFNKNVSGALKLLI